MFDVNLKYVYRVLKVALTVMTGQGTDGSIVSSGSHAGTAGHGSPNMAASGAAKSGWRTSALSAAHIAGMNAAIPLRRRGKPEDIANAVVVFASSMSGQVTGQVLGVDGGVSIQGPMPDLSGIGKS